MTTLAWWCLYIGLTVGFAAGYVLCSLFSRSDENIDPDVPAILINKRRHK
jgi:hypothetical protein